MEGIYNRVRQHIHNLIHGVGAADSDTQGGLIHRKVTSKLYTVSHPEHETLKMRCYHIEAVYWVQTVKDK